MANNEQDRKVKLFLRLTDSVDERLRFLWRRGGEFGRFIDAALTSVDLGKVRLVADPVQRERQMYTTVSDVANERLRLFAERRGCARNLLANSALHHWLDYHNGR
jgi:hypothetical protein